MSSEGTEDLDAKKPTSKKNDRFAVIDLVDHDNDTDDDDHDEPDQFSTASTRNKSNKPSMKRQRVGSRESDSNNINHCYDRSSDAAMADEKLFDVPMKLFATVNDLEERHRRSHDRNHWSWTQCKTLRELLGFDGTGNNNNSPPRIEWIVICNYMIDFEFLLDEVPELLSIPMILVFYGIAETPFDGWTMASTGTARFVRLSPSDTPNTSSNPTQQRIPFGVHHSKIFLLGMADGRLRVLVHTANLRYSDIHLKAQGAYMQDFPRKQEPSTQSSTSDFENTLVAYFSSYGHQELDPTTFSHDRSSSSATRTEKDYCSSLTDVLKQFDFSSAKAILIPSTPGYHRVNGVHHDEHRLGHWKLRHAVARFTTTPTGMVEAMTAKSTVAHSVSPIAMRSSRTVCQFSSMGSLTETYLQELQTSMDTALARQSQTQGIARKPLRLNIVYPTVNEIRCSIEGYRGGGSVPGTNRNVNKPFLKRLYHKWSTSSSSSSQSIPNRNNTDNPIWKGRNVPHIKTYFQSIYTNDDEHDDSTFSLAWLVLTSHNLSKAAWGEIQTSTRYDGRRLFIRHWEMGVFFSPKLWGVERIIPWYPSLDVETSPVAASESTLQATLETRAQGTVAVVPIPYNVHPEPYGPHDRPWAVDGEYEEPDTFGRSCTRDR